MSKSKYKMLGICMLLPLCLTGCTNPIDAMVGFARSLLFGIAVIMEAFFCITQGLSLVNQTIRSKRGTNVVTRFARNGKFSMKIQQITTAGTVVTLIAAGLGFGSHGVLGTLVALPSLALVIAAFVVLHKDTKSEQRIKDSRVMTKASLDVAAQTATAVGTTAGVAAEMCGVVGASQMGKAIGNITSDVAANASANMQVEGAVQLDMSATANEIAGMSSKMIGTEKIANPELFLEQAAKTGIPVQGRSIEEIAMDVVKFAPTSRLQNLDPNKSQAELAMDILNAYQQPEALPGPRSYAPHPTGGEA